LTYPASRSRHAPADDPHGLARRVLFAALDPSPEPLSHVTADELMHLPGDWLFDRIRAHKLGALFAERLVTSGLADPLPSGVRDRLSQVRRASEKRVQRTARTIEELTEICERLDIPLFFIKGVHLSQDIYGDPRLRAYGDVDIVMHRDDIDVVESALLDAGYFFYFPTYLERVIPKRVQRRVTQGLEPGSREARRELAATFHRNFNYVLRDGAPRLPVELHWHIGLPGKLTVTPEELWQQTVDRHLLGIPAKVFNLEATLLQCAMHAMEHLPTGMRLLHFLDVAWIVSEVGDEIDPSKLNTLASAWGCERDMACALDVVEAVFPFELPHARRLVPRRSVLSGWFLRLAGANEGLLDLAQPETRLGLLLDQVRREAAWDLALGRHPRRAGRRLRGLSAAVRRRLPWTRSSEGSETADAGLEGRLAPELLALAQGRGSDVSSVVSLTTLPSTRSRRGAFKVTLVDTRVFKGRMVDSEEAALRIHRLSEYLDRNHFPRVVDRRGRALLVSWIQGDPVGGAPWLEADLERYGRILGSVHATELPRDTRRSFAFPVERWNDRIDGNLDRLVALRALERAEADRIRDVVERSRPKHIRAGLIHGDFAPNNIVVDPSGRPWVVDSENLAVDSLAFDLARAWYRWALDEPFWSVFLRGYVTHGEPDEFLDHMDFWCGAALAEAARFRIELDTSDADVPLQRLRSFSRERAGR
jgi:hypothetical protein